MSRRVEGVTLDDLERLPLGCRRCVYWELAPHLREQAERFGETEVEKEAWISSVLLEWGSCGRIAYDGADPAGFLLYAPPNVVPRASAFPTSPPSPDAVLLTAFFVLPRLRGSGFGRALVQAAVGDLTRRGAHAVEAFGAARPALDAESEAGSIQPDSGAPRHHCVVPAAFLRGIGFKTVAAHPRWPRLRLELRSGLSWKAGVEAALERLLDEATATTATSSATRA